ncbi:hypothetical protein [Peijinzhouia sedimentorum]
MKTMKNNKSMSMIVSIILLMSTTFSLQAQESESLKRDMEVTSNLLSTLLKTNTGNSFMRVGNNGVETSYNEGFGVVYDLKGSNVVFRSVQGFVTPTSPASNSSAGIAETKENNEETRARGVATVGARSENISITSYGRVGNFPTSIWGNNSESSEQDKESTVKEFLIEYGSFLKDLKPEEKIMVQYPFVKADESSLDEESGVTIIRYYTSGNLATKSFSIQKKDADAYRSGSISKEVALSRISIEENLPEEIPTDLRVLGELMNSLYSERNSKTYFSTSNPTIVKTNGMGAIYSWAVYSAYNDNFGYRLPTLTMGAQNVNEQERNEIVKAAYPIFLESFKESLVDYGRTIKSLEGNEKIVFNIKMTRCESCGIPDVLKVEMDKATIEDYNQGKLSRSQAISKLKVIEN